MPLGLSYETEPVQSVKYDSFKTVADRLEGRTLIPFKESVYTQEQLDLYLDKIQYPKYKHLVEPHDLLEAPFKKLQLLMRLHITTFPWENTRMHYTADHVMNVTAENVFQRLVVDGVEGSYCFGQNTLFQGMLRRMGYRVYSAGARVLLGYQPGTPLPAWSHMILLVQPFENNPVTYLVDAGFGASGQCRPILLDDTLCETQGTTKTERHRVIRTLPPTSASPISSWELQYTHNPQDITPTWSPIHLFTEYEAYPADYIQSNFSLCRLPAGRSGTLRSNVMCCKYFFVNPEDPLESDLGKYVLHGAELKRSTGSESEVIRLFKAGEEKERIVALKTHFGIDICAEGERHMKDTTALL